MTPALASESLATRMFAPLGIVTRTAAPAPLPHATAANESANVDRRIQANRNRIISSLKSRVSRRAPALSPEPIAASLELAPRAAHSSLLHAHGLKLGPAVAIAMFARIAKFKFLTALPTRRLGQLQRVLKKYRRREGIDIALSTFG
jgi:hypothetical protein